ncbi:NAD-dependent DNA ligase LigA [Leadbettera azotonutricia]|uniref:DNA ligase n=1 Tax=Leadbettera azotonutricia (strain ATCC BAA-888 / DSM 13862 / ZAS-9) TaxID=545695 RepID=F5YBK8_LEAAZ|nr:NAD-dependent DNA ligase LigA [Leadbettera azotonutricia]AEF82006.1 DNA ligase (NAD(+)) [Leadbettera azotonutricia ZAS-9]
MKNDRIAALERLIKKYQDSYYNGEAEISDAEFDLLWDELRSLDPGNALLKKVGADGQGPDPDGFPKARHLIPMGSQDKAANPEEFRSWAKKMGMETEKEGVKAETSLTPDLFGLTKIFLVQFKLDGASLELQYEKGKLRAAVTRGDGVTGDEITHNALAMSGVVAELKSPFTGGVRGEVVMPHEIWKKKYPDKANCRNAANGIMRRKDGMGCEDLKLVTYDAAATGDDAYFTDELEKIAWLKKQGFETTDTKTFSDIEDIIAYRDEIAAKREKLPVDIDGLVIKDRATDMTDLRRARPEHQIAFKFELETAYSILRQVEWSESGATYTPIGIVDPVRLAGTTVKRANLNNPDMIRAMGLKIGSAVSVVKRGEIIPKIEGLAPEGALEEGEEKSEIEFPSKCISCGTDLIDGGTRLYCPNAACPKRLVHRVEKWVSVLGIMELGEKLLARMFAKGNVRQIGDLYTIEAAELAEFERMGEASAAKVVRHIRTKRELSLAAFVAGFDFEGVGETIMDKVAAAGIDTLEKLREASVADLAAVYGLGDITAKTIADGVKECSAEMDRILGFNIIAIAPPPSSDSIPLKGLSFCFTGELASMKRNEAEEKIKTLGGSAKSSVVKDLSFLVTNDTESGSAKNKKANDLGVPILDEEEFLALLKNPQLAGEYRNKGH